MKPEYITLSDGRRVRIEWNMNALGEFTSLTGKEMADMLNMKEGRADIKTLRIIAWCAAMEGEAADGKSLGLNEIEFGRLMTMHSIVEFSGILAKQSSGAEKKNQAPRRFPLIHFRKTV